MLKETLQEFVNLPITVITPDGRSTKGICIGMKDENTFLFQIKKGIILDIPFNEVMIEF